MTARNEETLVFKTAIATVMIASLMMFAGCGGCGDKEKSTPSGDEELQSNSHIVIPEADLPGIVYDGAGERVFGGGKSLGKEINNLQQLLKKDPDNPLAHNNLGFLYYRVGEYGSAVKAFETAIEKKPDFPEAYCNLGLVYFNLGRYQMAVDYFERAVELNPTMADAYSSLGHIYQLTGQDEKARQTLETALKLNPNFALGYNNLGLLERKAGQFDQAIDCFIKAIELKPDMAPAHYNLAHVFMEKGMTMEAAAELQTCLKIDSGHIQARRRLLEMGVVPESAGQR